VRLDANRYRAYFDYCSPYDAVWTRCRIPWRSVRSPPRNGCWTLDRTWLVRPASVDHVVWRAAATGAESASRRARAAARAVVRGRAPTAVERRARTTTSGKTRTGRTRRHRRPPPDLAYIDRYCRRPRAIRRVMCPSVDKSSVLSAVYAEQGLCNCRASVRPSVCPSYSVAAAASLLLRARRQEIWIDCCTAGGQQQPRRSRSAAHSSKCGQHRSLITLRSACDDPSGGRCTAHIPQPDTPHAS